jgi:hypothetical protein
MESANIFVWRLRLCVLLALAGQTFVHFEKHGSPASREGARQSSQDVKCAIHPRDAGIRQVSKYDKRVQDCPEPANRPGTPSLPDHRVIAPDAVSMKASGWDLR